MLRDSFWVDFIIAKLKTTHFSAWLELINIVIGDKKPRALARGVSFLTHTQTPLNSR